jgi:APA family basic amino acid/polyamine antiporter
VSFGDWIFFGLTALGLIVLRKKMPDRPRPYKTWGYPVVPFAFFLISAAVVVNVFVSSFAKSLIGSAIILAGLPLYYYSWKKEKTHGIRAR